MPCAACYRAILLAIRVRGTTPIRPAQWLCSRRGRCAMNASEIQASSVVAPFCARADLQRAVSCRHKSCLTRSATTPPSSSSASPGAPLRVVCPEPVLAKHDNLLHHSPGRRCLFGPFVRRGFVVRTSAKRQQRECVPPIHPPPCLPDAPAWLPSLPGVPACLPAQLQCFCALLLPSGLLSVCARLTVCANVIT